MAYLVLARIELVSTVILPNKGMDTIVLASNGMSIRSVEQLVPSHQWGKVVWVAKNVGSSVGHDDKRLSDESC